MCSFQVTRCIRGDAPSYSEDAAPDPVNYYGQTKCEAEKKIFEAMPEAKIIRISLVLGFPIDGGNSFYMGLKNKLESGQDIFCPANEIRTPIDVATLAKAVLELAMNSFSGVLHLGATSSISRFELTRRAAEIMGFAGGKVIKMSEEEVAKRTPRHNNGILDVSKAGRVLKTPMPSVDEAVASAYETISNMR